VPLVGLLLIVPVPAIIDQFTNSAWVQLTFGSVYGWALVLLFALLVVREGRAAITDGAPIRERARRAS